MFAFLRRTRRATRIVLALVGALVLITGVLVFRRVSLWHGPARPQGLFPADGDQHTLLRGPYLQQPGPGRMIVRWRTAEPSRGMVRFGPPGQALSRSASEGGVTTDHEVNLEGLDAATSYGYAVGTADKMIASGEGFIFRTPPAAGHRGPARVLVLGDAGTASPTARQVRDVYASRFGNADVWLMLGDNAYNHGSDLEYQAALFETFRELLWRLPPWPARGNHDEAAADGHIPYFDIFTLPVRAESGGVPSATEAYYSFEHGDVHFVCLDTHGSSRHSEGPMARWLVKDLADARDRGVAFVIAFFHHPPYSKGTHDSDKERALVEVRRHLVPLMEAGGVDIVLSGHSHNYERSLLIAGHQGASDTFARAMIIDDGTPVSGVTAAPVFHKDGRGTVYVVIGSSGEPGRRFRGLDHPALPVASPEAGFVFLQTAPGRMDAQFVTAAGEVKDRFAIEKRPLTVPAAVPRASDP
jgi:hypothetical protein